MHKDIPGNIQKYFHLRKKFALMVQSVPVDELVLTANVRYNDRAGSYLGYNFSEGAYVTNSFQPYWLFDLGVNYRWSSFTFHIEATNIFDQKYIDIGSIYQPGRWLSGGVIFKFSDF